MPGPAVPGATGAPLIVTPQGVSPQAAARAYRSVDAGGGATPDFGSLVARAAEGAVELGQRAEAQATQVLAGSGNLTDMVQAVTRAELTLQTTTAIRDRVVQAYQDIMKMAI